MNAFYDMNRETRGKVVQFAKERNYPPPGQIYKVIYAALVVQHKLSLIMREIDQTIDLIMLLNDRIAMSIREGNMTAIVLMKERKDEEKARLARLERLLMRESPMKKEPDENEITDEMILRAKDYPFEDLLPEGLKRGRCRCPIHAGQNTMSFSVKNNRGKCFSCGWPHGKSGDTIQFLMDTQGLSFPDAVRRLA